MPFPLPSDFKKIPEIDLYAVAQQYFTDCQYKQAREAYKTLCKFNKEKYLPPLIECYKAQIDEMMSSNRQSDAQTVRAYLKEMYGIDYLGTVVPAPVVAPLKSVVELFEASLKNSPEIEVERQAVVAALTALCAQEYDNAGVLIRAIGLHSPFADWKLFVKGLCLFYKGEDLKALEALNRISPTSLSGKAARAWIILLTNDTAGLKKIDGKETLMYGMCIAANKEEYSEILPRADYLWSTGRYRDSLRAIVALKNFPSSSNRVFALLGQLYFSVHKAFSEPQIAAYIKEVQRVFPLQAKTLTCGHLLVGRFMAHSSLLAHFEPEHIIKAWSVYAQIRATVKGNSAFHDALIFKKIGNYFLVPARAPHPFDFYENNEEPNLLEVSRGFFESSIETDDGDPETWLLLLNLLKKLKKKSDYNKLLDRAAVRFPDHKDILFKAGVSALERKSVPKGIKYLEQVRSLDPLDPQVRLQLQLAYFTQAHSFAKGKNKKYLDIMKSAEALCRPNSQDFSLGKEFFLARFAAFDNLFGDATAQQTHLGEAVAASRDPKVLYYFMSLMYRCYDTGQKLIYAVQASFETTRAHASLARRMIEVYKHASQITNSRYFYDELKSIEKQALLEIAQNTLSRADARVLIEFASDNSLYPIGKKVIKCMLAKDSHDPLFSFFKAMQNSHRLTFDALDRLEESAISRNDDEALILIRDGKKRLEYRAQSAFTRSPFAQYGLNDDFGDFPFDSEDFMEEMKKFMPKSFSSKKNNRKQFF